jgi:hypothetical protein
LPDPVLSVSRFSLAIASRDDLNSCCADHVGKELVRENESGGEENCLTEKAREKKPGADQPPGGKHALSHDNDAITDDTVRPCSQHINSSKARGIRRKSQLMLAALVLPFR